MGKIDNDFEERLKKYSEEINKMEITYQDGRVKYVNKKGTVNLKNRNTKDNYIYIQDDNRQNNCNIHSENFLILKNILRTILKLILTYIVFISIPFVANRISNAGVNGFISVTGTICISYFIINFIWIILG